MPRVLLTGFCAVPGPRRAGVQLRHVIRALTALHSVDLLVVREGEQAYVERQGSVRVLRVPTHEADPRSQIQAFQRALKRQLDGADYDVVHCRDSWSGIPVLEARSRLGYAMVYDLSRSPLGETWLDGELDAQYARDEEACLTAADLVLAPTPAAVRSLHGRGKPGRVVLSPLGVDIDRFDWEDPPAGGPPRILYIGSIDPGRGVRVLVRAMASIAREVDARLVLAGSMSPKFDQPLRDGIRELGLSDKVEVLGPVDHDQLPALLATATVCVVPAAADLTPSPTVVFPTKILEYMACRRAIVAPRRETLSHVVENHREALLFEPGDPIDLARKVLRLLGEPLLRERIAQNAYERVRRDFTASATRRALRTAYRGLTDRFTVPFLDTSAEDAPKVELLADDDFEATVFEEAPAPPPIDTALNKLLPLEEALQSLGDPDGTGSTSDESVIAPPPPEHDETVERAPAPPGRRGRWQPSASGAVHTPGPDDWIVTNVAQVVRTIDERSESWGRGPAGFAGGEGARPLSIDAEDVVSEMLIEEGTPIEGTAAGPMLSGVEASFVAGEIDVPTPPSFERRARDERDGLDRRGRDDDAWREPDVEREHDTPAVEFIAASAILGQPEPIDLELGTDTGSRTPPIARR